MRRVKRGVTYVLHREGQKTESGRKPEQSLGIFRSHRAEARAIPRHATGKGGVISDPSREDQGIGGA